MAWNLNSDRPIYAQILEVIQLRIISGRYRPGEKIPSVRDLAAEARVNPNTMQKALSELERNGLVETQRTSGRMVTEDMEMIQETRSKLAREQWKTQKQLQIYETKDTERQQVSLRNSFCTFFFTFIFPNSPNNTSTLLKDS